MRCTIVVEKSPTGFGAYAPDLPGCVAVAGTEDEVRVLIEDAIELHLEAMGEEGKPGPASFSSARR